ERGEPLEPGILAEKGPEECLGALRRQRVEAKLTVGDLVAPAMLILGAIVDQEAEPGRREALDEAIQKRLGLGIEPLEVLEHDEQGLGLSFPEHEPPDRLEGALAPLGRIESLPGVVVRGDVE